MPTTGTCCRLPEASDQLIRKRSGIVWELVRMRPFKALVNVRLRANPSGWFCTPRLIVGSACICRRSHIARTKRLH